MKISVIHATRRPEQALAMKKLWLEKADSPADVEYIFGLDEDDTRSQQVLAGERFSLPGGATNYAYNDAAKLATGEVLILGSDDMFPIQDWDRLIVERLREGKGAKPDTAEPGKLPARALFVSDGHRTDRLSTLNIITRALYQRWGYCFPPNLKSMYGDTWLTQRACRDGVMVDAGDLVFEHRHPSHTGEEPDAVCLATNAPERYKEGRKALEELLEPLRISLCMICGNEAQVILRCLESAKDAFDELCLVRAVGSTHPDATDAIAANWCGINGKDFRFDEYRNSEPFPHVDHFGAARNLSFSLATGDWLMWLDCDDYLNEIDCQRIREAVSLSAFDALYCPYVGDGGVPNRRERLIRRGHGKWRGAIHETCTITGTAGECLQIEVHHSDHTHKTTSSAARNAAILETVLDNSPRHWFYLQSDLKILGRKDEAIRAAHAALALLTSEMVEERYAVLLNLAELEPAAARDHLFAALQAQPHRREALAYLTQRSLMDGRTSDAVSFFRMMDALPAPSPLPWTHQPGWYERRWARNLLRVKLLHASGQVEQASKERDQHMADPEFAAHVDTLPKMT